MYCEHLVLLAMYQNLVWYYLTHTASFMTMLAFILFLQDWCHYCETAVGPIISHFSYLAAWWVTTLPYCLCSLATVNFSPCPLWKAWWGCSSTQSHLWCQTFLKPPWDLNFMWGSTKTNIATISKCLIFMSNVLPLRIKDSQCCTHSLKVAVASLLNWL